MRRHLKKTLDIRVFQLVEGRHLCKFAAKNRLRGSYLACSSGLTNKKADVRILPGSGKSSCLAASLNEAKCVTVGTQKCRRCAWTTWQQACYIRSLRFEDSGLAVAHPDKIQPSICYRPVRPEASLEKVQVWCGLWCNADHITPSCIGIAWHQHCPQRPSSLWLFHCWDVLYISRQDKFSVSLMCQSEAYPSFW